MGATTFYDESKGDTPRTVFDALVARAQYDHGHSGYTGTIAEKRGFQFYEPGVSAREFQDLLENGDPDLRPKVLTLSQPQWSGAYRTYHDKWGPAVCCLIDPTDVNSGWAFFGWASC